MAHSGWLPRQNLTLTGTKAIKHFTARARGEVVTTSHFWPTLLEQHVLETNPVLHGRLKSLAHCGFQTIMNIFRKIYYCKLQHYMLCSFLNNVNNICTHRQYMATHKCQLLGGTVTVADWTGHTICKGSRFKWRLRQECKKKSTMCMKWSQCCCWNIMIHDSMNRQWAWPVTFFVRS